MIPLTTTTLPVGLVRDLEVACARPGAGVIRIHMTAEGAAVIVDRRRDLAAPLDVEVPPPCPNCSTPMTFDRAVDRLRCPDCGYSGTVRAYRRILRVVEVAGGDLRHGQVALGGGAHV